MDCNIAFKQPREVAAYAMDRVSISWFSDAEHPVTSDTILQADPDDCCRYIAVGLAVHPFANFRVAKHSREDRYFTWGQLRAGRGHEIEPGHPRHIGRGLAVHALAKVRVAKHSDALRKWRTWRRFRTWGKLKTDPATPLALLPVVSPCTPLALSEWPNTPGALRDSGL